MEVKTDTQKLNVPEELTMVEEARKVVAELKEQNKIKLELLEREEKVKAKELLGGRSEAGIIQPEAKEETSREYAEKVLAGDLDV